MRIYYVTMHAKMKRKSAKIFFELAMNYENTTPDEPSQQIWSR